MIVMGCPSWETDSARSWGFLCLAGISDPFPQMSIIRVCRSAGLVYNMDMKGCVRWVISLMDDPLVYGWMMGVVLPADTCSSLSVVM